MTRIGSPSQPIGPTPTGEPSQQKTSLPRSLPQAQRADIFAQVGSAPPAPQGPSLTAQLQKQLAGGDMIRLNQSGEAVQELQQLLNRVGIQPPLRPDGVFGAVTEAALRQFQADKGIAVDGVFGPQSLQALQNSLGQDEHAARPLSAVQAPPQSLNEILSEHTVRVAALEEEQKRDEHESPIINVRKLPTHRAPRPIMASASRIPERTSEPHSVTQHQGIAPDLPSVSMTTQEENK